MSLDVVTLGNAVLDLLVTLDDTNSSARINKETHELCVKAGEKILADNVGFVVGGGACRVAISLSRLGMRPGILAEIGNDELAQRIRTVLTDEGVDVTGLVQAESATSFTVGLNFQKERTLFTHLTTGKHDFPLASVTSSWMYVAALGKPWEKAYSAIVSLQKEKNIQIAFNPGPSQFQEGVDSYLPLLSVSTILFINKQEAQIITGDETEDISILLHALLQMGPSIVVITDGRNGSYALGKDGASYGMAIKDSNVVERTGAGDAYAAGFLAATIAGKDIQEAMRWGTLNAAAVVQEFGGLSGLLTKEKLEKMLLESDIPPVTIL